MTDLANRPVTGSAVAIPAPAGTAVDGQVTPDALRLVYAGTSANTRRGYAHDWAAFTAWCASTGRTALPATAETLVSYVGHLAGQGLAPATISRAMGCIQSAHGTAGHVADTKAARLALRGHAREMGRKTRKADPVTVATLRALVAALDTTTLIGQRDQALLVLGFAMGARRSELVGLDIADVAEAAEGLAVHVRRSKTDRHQATPGREVAITYGKRLETCPVRAVRAWLARLAEHGITTGPLFVRITRHGAIGRAQSGRGSADGRITGETVADVVRRTAERAGLAPSVCWSGHSLRRGMVTEAYAAGAPPVYIGRHGGWADGSATLAGYVGEVDQWQHNPLNGVGL